MPKLYDNGTGDLIGEISDEQLQFLKDQLEEESLEDRDYAIEEMTLEYFEEQNGDPELIKLLRDALGSRDQFILRWE
jgi:hypothetical protein